MAERTANERIRDDLVRRQVELQRLGQGLSADVVDLLDRTEESIVADIRRALSRGASLETSAGLRRLDALEKAVRATRAQAMSDGEDGVDAALRELAGQEGVVTTHVLDTNSPVELDLVLPSVQTLASLVDEAFEGRTLQEWFDRTAEADAQRIMDAVRVGLTRGQSIEDIVASVVGTSGSAGVDGVTAITRNQVTSLVRTAVNAYSNKARQATFDANRDIISEEVYTATLDARTSAICRSLDGKVYKVGEGPMPPQHFGCRSIRVALIGQDLAGTRPAKPATEKMLLGEFNDIEGTKARVRADLERGLKGKFDEYKRRRLRELIGQVPSSTSYQAWLSRQSASFQDEVLGATKGKLFRSGGLDLAKYVHRNGTELTLAELAKRNAKAFVRAGLDPADFITGG